MDTGIIISLTVGIVCPVLGWLFNTIITKKIDAGNIKDQDIEKKQKEDFDLLFKRLDEVKQSCVRKDMYDQAMQFHQKETDNKFNNLIESMNKQFDNVEKNIDDVKDLINEKFNHKKGE